MVFINFPQNRFGILFIIFKLIYIKFHIKLVKIYADSPRKKTRRLTKNAGEDACAASAAYYLPDLDGEYSYTINWQPPIFYVSIISKCSINNIFAAIFG